MVSYIIIFRIPSHLKNRLTRKNDQVDFKMEELFGIIKYTSYNVHNYEIPNNHYRNVFNNICPEDFSIYFGIQSSNVNQNLYFKVMKSSSDTSKHEDKIHRHNPDQIIKEGLYEENFKLSQKVYNLGKYVFTPIALLAGAAASV